MKRAFLFLVLLPALCLLAACGMPGTAGHQTIADIVPWLSSATATFPYQWVGEHPVDLPTSADQAGYLRELLGSISLEGFEACEPHSIGGGESIVMDIANADNPAEACRIQILWAGDPVRSRNHAKTVYPDDAYYVGFQFPEGGEQAYLGQSADFPFHQLSQFLDELINDREDTANTGLAWLLDAPEEQWVLSKADAATVQVTFDAAAGAAPAECPGGYDGVVEIRGVTYRVQFSTGCFSREEGGETVTGRLDGKPGWLSDVLFRCHFPNP